MDYKFTVKVNEHGPKGPELLIQIFSGDDLDHPVDNRNIPALGATKEMIEAEALVGIVAYEERQATVVTQAAERQTALATATDLKDIFEGGKLVREEDVAIAVAEIREAKKPKEEASEEVNEADMGIEKEGSEK